MKAEAKTKRSHTRALLELRQQIDKLEKAKAKPSQIEKALLKSEEEAGRLAKENALLAEIGRIIGSSPNIDEVFEHFSKAVSELLPCERIVVGLYNPSKSASFVRYVGGVDVPKRRVGKFVPLAGTATGECVSTKSSLLIQPEGIKEIEKVLSQFPKLLPNFDLGIRSIVMVPLMAKDQIIGVLNFQSTKTKAYSDQDVKLAESIASQIAGAVANAQLYQERAQAEAAARKNEKEAKRLAQENAVMAEIGRIISSTLDIEEVYEKFIEEVRKLIQGDRITIAIVNRDGSTYTLAYAWGLAVGERKTGGFYPLAGTLVEEVIRTQSSMLAQGEDIEKVLRSFPTLAPYYKAGLQSMIVVPLISKNNVIGTLHFRSSKPKAYTQSDMILAGKVVNQITGAIDNARLYSEHKQAEKDLRKREEENRKLAKENEIIAEIGRIIGSTLDIEEVYEYFAEEVRKIIPVDGITIGVINYKDKVTHVPYSAGFYVPGRTKDDTVPLAGTATEEILRTRSSLLIQEKSEEVTRRFSGLSPYFQSGVRSFLIVPLVSRDRVIGVIFFLSKKVKAYSAKDLNLAERIGNQIAGAVANAQLYQERTQAENALRKSEEGAKRLAQENALVAEIGRIIGSAPDIDEVFERFSKAVAQLIPCDRILINLRSQHEDYNFVRYAAGIDVPHRGRGEYVSLAGTATAECLRTKSSLLIQPKDVKEIEEWVARFPMFLPNFEAGIRSAILVPLIAEDKTIGVLSLRTAKTKAYTDQDVRLAESIASQIAGAVANAQLYDERTRAEEAARRSGEEARRLAQENALVAEVGKIIGSTLDIKEVYERFAAETRKLISFDRIAMNVIDPKSYSFAIPYVSGMQIENRAEGEIIPLAGTGTEEIMRTRTSIFIHEENIETIIDRLPGLIPVRKAGFQSIMMVPLISNNEVIAVLNIQSTQPGAYAEDDLRVAERVSSQIAGAVANALLFDEHQRATEALRQSEERYRTILGALEDGYYEVDIAGNFTFFNDALCRILGYSKDEIIGMNNRQYTDQENAKKIYQFFNTVYRTGQTVRRLDWEIIRKDGGKKYVEASVSLIKDTEGKKIGFRGIVQDITERMQAEKEMAELQEQLRQSQKIEAIGQLAGGIAHDFNNALTLIKTSAQLTLLRLKAGDPLRQTFELIDKATEQSANLTRQLLAFSRRQIMELKVIGLNSLLQDMDKMLHRVIGEDIELVSVLAEDLGRVKVDPGQMEQVILNFVLNARDAMPQGGKLTIETANMELDDEYVDSHVGVKAGRYVQVAVSDTGTGMTPEVRDRVFEPFFTTKERGKGTGLGLSTVYGIVKQSGGNVWVYSELGKGTTFKVYLPRVDEPLREEEGKDLQREQGLPRGGETVLVAEDEVDVRNLVVQILRNQGYEVLEAANGGEAYMICERHEGAIDLLMTDVVMPLMSGRELADRLLLLHPGMKVLYTSGYTDDAIVRHGVLEEGVNFIPKPFSVESLALKVREVLDK